MAAAYSRCAAFGGLRAPVVLALGVLAILGNGCASTSAPRTVEVSSAIETSNPMCRLEREEHISLGGFKLSLVKGLVRLVDEPEAAAILSNLNRVEVATYRVATPASCSADDWTVAFGDEMARNGWWPMVVERDGNDSSWVFARGDREGDLDGLFVVAIDQQELEVVCVEGRLDRLMAEAMAAEPFEADEIFESGR